MPNGQIVRAIPANVDSSGNLPANSLSGIAAMTLLMLDAQASVLPSGYWVPWGPFRHGSFEVTGDFAGSVSLFGCNALEIPYNYTQLTVGGTPHTGDILTVKMKSFSFQTGQITATYTVKSTDSTTALITAGLNDAILAAIRDASNIIGDTEDNALPASLSSSADVGSSHINLGFRFPLSPITITVAVTGSGATTTLAAAPIDDGLGFLITGTTLAVPGRVEFSASVGFISAKLPTLTSTKVCTAVVQGAIP